MIRIIEQPQMTKELTGHSLKRQIKERYSYLKPVSAKFTKANTCWKTSYWEIVIETSTVFLTIQEKKDKDSEIREWISNTIKNLYDDEHRFETRITIGWPMTVEDVKHMEQEELQKKKEEEEEIRLENEKRKRIDEENSELERSLRSKIVKKDMGTMDDFKKTMRNEEFDEQVRELWRKELGRKADLLMSYPFKELEAMRNERSNIEYFIRGVIPHVSSGDYREPFFGDMDRVFPQAKHNICCALRAIEGCSSFYNYNTFYWCIQIYHNVHRNLDSCSVETLKMYSRIFVV